jgi:ABC-type transport system substrate-binding protein
VLLASCGGAPAATPDTGAATAAPGAAAAGTPQPGGIMTVAYQNDIATLDPAIGYDWNNWPMEKMVFDALMDYDNLHLQAAAGREVP